MDARTVIDLYVSDVAGRLPRRQRDDIALELHTLLTEELKAAAAQAGREPDAALATEVVRHFGQPEEVANHYRPQGFTLVEPEHAPIFVKIAAAAVVTQWALTLPLVFESHMSFGAWWTRWGFTAFAWVGVLLAWFALATWTQRRHPVSEPGGVRPWTHWIFWIPMSEPWKPVDHEATNRRAGLGALPLGVLFGIFFVAPAWFLNLLLPPDTGTRWATYDPQFQRWLLLPLLALMFLRLALFAVAALSARWKAATEGLRFAIWVAFVGLLWWAWSSWVIFAMPFADLAFKAWLTIFLIINVIQIGVWIRRALRRVRMPDTLPRVNGSH